MDKEEFKFSDKKIPIERKDEIDSSYKIIFWIRKSESK
ncbi:hypothetical protein ES703_29989 [subsurface metagenome]